AKQSSVSGDCCLSAEVPPASTHHDSRGNHNPGRYDGTVVVVGIVIRIVIIVVIRIRRAVVSRIRPIPGAKAESGAEARPVSVTVGMPPVETAACENSPARGSPVNRGPTAYKPAAVSPAPGSPLVKTHRRSQYQRKESDL